MAGESAGKTSLQSQEEQIGEIVEIGLGVVGRRRGHGSEAVLSESGCSSVPDCQSQTQTERKP